ncbi:DUF4825 domain-containing protein [Anaerocolumna sedimenticola]|uniref:DUF4825 domain-containing protein n=1 Tax=Anaerocolumna sedimenticola TaxID=2696063 RepID=A0A6P1TPT7_9FIRM|nr:DUF4825 domain-containing protein [Anaerocolumna sedimenticola]QHQ62994.1 DUF4825 domain-containing protein [Anaerocolumna sedimenticola]
MMKIRNRIITVLLIIGAILYIIVRFIIIPDNARKEEEYNKAQLNAATHDLNRILPYKSPYMGDAPNIINLYNNLPMAVDRTFHLLSDELTLEINYKDDLLLAGKKSIEMQGVQAGEDDSKQDDIYQYEVFKDLLYNSTAAFALIDNLKKINYNFSDINYSVTRNMIEDLYSVKLSDLLTEENWRKLVQDNLNDPELVSSSMEKAFEVP